MRWRQWRRSPTARDVLGALVLVAVALGILVGTGDLGRSSDAPTTVCTLAVCALFALRTRQPIAVSVLMSALILVPEVTSNGPAFNGAPTAPVTLIILVMSYTLGAGPSWLWSLVGLIPLVGTANLTPGTFNPLIEMITIGPWIVGVIVSSQHRAALLLERRARELDREREIFAAQSVRYERARIARELHDIVAHAVSLMVVQASAGERLVDQDPERAAQALESISEAALQADLEIGRLVEMLDTSMPAANQTGLRLVEELVTRGRLSGLSISCQMRGDLEQVDPDASDALYRLVQEGITNAVKHAPGAPIVVTMEGEATRVNLGVVNGPGTARTSGLERLGGGNGIVGMRERLAACGGSVEAGPTPDGGWRILGSVERRPMRSSA